MLAVSSQPTLVPSGTRWTKRTGRPTGVAIDDVDFLTRLKQGQGTVEGDDGGEDRFGREQHHAASPPPQHVPCCDRVTHLLKQRPDGVAFNHGLKKVLILEFTRAYDAISHPKGPSICRSSWRSGMYRDVL